MQGVKLSRREREKLRHRRQRSTTGSLLGSFPRKTMSTLRHRAGTLPLPFTHKFILRLASVLETGIRKKVFRKIDPYHMAVALEDPEQHPYGANIPVIRDIFLKGVLAK